MNANLKIKLIGFIIGVVQDSVETALNSSGDVFFTATAEEFDRKKKGEEIVNCLKYEEDNKRGALECSALWF